MMLTTAYFLIAILGASFLCGGLVFAVIDWLLYSVLFTKLTERLRSSLSGVFSFAAALCVALFVLVHLFLSPFINL